MAGGAKIVADRTAFKFITFVLAVALAMIARST
jgi:hypothetical protein